MTKANDYQLLPSLLDRLTDDEPNRPALGYVARKFSMRQLRRNILRDLAWLLDTGSLGQVEDLSAFPCILKSVVNYGWLELSGTMIGSLNCNQLANSLSRAITDFEPRLKVIQLEVRTETRSEGSDHAVVVTIVGDLFAEPAPLRLTLRTEIDSENGDVNISEVG